MDDVSTLLTLIVAFSKQIKLQRPLVMLDKNK